MMKRIIAAIGIALLLVPAAFAREQTVLARVTVYWPCGDADQYKAANGARLRPGHVAVDPDKIPYGSKVVFSDTTCVAVDTGPAVVSRKAARRSGRNAKQREALVVDRFFPSKQQAMAWANANPHFMTLRVLSPGSKSEPDGSSKISGARLAQTNSDSPAFGHYDAAMVATPSGLQTADLAALAILLPFAPFWRVVRRRS
jgi:3D (Asp-Asp-Asp) domain-containing protein